MANKFGSGTLGISKLFNEASLAQIRSTHTVRYLEIDKLDGHKKNRQFDQSKLEALALNIEDSGLQEPIVVTPTDGDRYLILSGHRRVAAHRLLVDQGKTEFQTIPAIVRNGLDEDKSEETLIDTNLFTEPLTPAELAKELARKKELLEKRRANGEKISGKLTEIIAAELGITASTARELDTINRRAAPEIKELFENGEIYQKEAFLASRLPEEKQRDLAAAKKAGAKRLLPSKGRGVGSAPPLNGENGGTGVGSAPPLNGENGGTGVGSAPPLGEPEQLTIEGETEASAPTESPVRQLKTHRITAKEASIEYGGISYLCAFGTHVNGGWIAILNFGVSAELSASKYDVKHNTRMIREALELAEDEWLPTGDALTEAARHIAEIVTEMIGGM